MNRKEEQEALFERIPYGSKEPLVVDVQKNRYFRKLVADANLDGDCIINVDGGYYRPIPGEDDDDFNYYSARELNRARAILYKRKKMKETYANRKEIIDG